MNKKYLLGLLSCSLVSQGVNYDQQLVRVTNFKNVKGPKQWGFQNLFAHPCKATILPTQ